MRSQARHRRAGKTGEGIAAQGPCHCAREMLGQERDVLGADPQGRHGHDVDGEAVEATPVPVAESNA